MTILVAPDKFKGSASAGQVAALVAGELRARGLDAVEMPIADGGEGSLDTVLACGFSARVASVIGPDGRSRVRARWAISGRDAVAVGGQELPGPVAVIEAAQACGLALLPGRPTRLDAMRSTSFGVGELIARALDHAARTIVLCVGGSACTDGGAGMMQALGARLVEHNGLAETHPAGGVDLAQIARVDMAGLDRRLAGVRIVLARDVDNPLTGPDGAAAVFAPQKGAGKAEVDLLAAGLEQWAEVVMSRPDSDPGARTERGLEDGRWSEGERRSEDERWSGWGKPGGGIGIGGGGSGRAGILGAGGVIGPDTPGAGAAGGIAFAALALLGADQLPGADLMMDLAGFDLALAQAELVVSGEGSFDAQSLRGKGPMRVAQRALAVDVPVAMVVGRCTVSPAEIPAGITIYSAEALEPDLARRMQNWRPLLAELSQRIAEKTLERHTE